MLKLNKILITYEKASVAQTTYYTLLQVAHAE